MDGGDDGGDAGIGPAGPGPSESAGDPSATYGGDDGSFGDPSFGDGPGLGALASLSDMTDLSSVLSDFGMDAMNSFSMPDLSFSTPQSFISQLQDFNKSKIAQVAKGLLAMAGKGIPAPVTAATSNNPAASIAKGGIATAAAGAFGPIGALGFMGLDALGAFDGLSNSLGQASNMSSFQGNDANMGIGEALPGLAGLYAGYQGMRDTDKMLGGLQGLYTQNSPYAQMLRQQLQRKDAAGGRRSQYGPREVELQAKLAQMASGQIGAMSQLQQRNNINRAQMLQQGLGAFQKLGGMNALQKLFGMGGRGGMFDTAATQGLGQLSNIFGNDGMNSFGALPPDLGFDIPDFGG